MTWELCGLVNCDVLKMVMSLSAKVFPVSTNPEDNDDELRPFSSMAPIQLNDAFVSQDGLFI